MESAYEPIFALESRVDRYHRQTSDILSFYNEELSGEGVNRVSLLAACWKVQKSAVVRYLSAEAACAHERVLRTLRTEKEAYAAYIQFSHGYVGFHAALSRYRLDELGLQPTSAFITTATL